MRVITTSNLEFNYAEIESALKNAQLISVDIESSGAVPTFQSDANPPRFATPAELYSHIRQSIHQLIIIQFGLTTFAYNNVKDKYTAQSYTFIVYPRSVASLKKKFQFSTSAISFLFQQGYDLNKFVCKGVNYMSSVEEAAFLKDLRSGALLGSGDRGLTQEEDAEIQKHCSNISQWEVNAREGESLELEELDYSNKLFVYLLNKEIQKRFHTVWTAKGTYDTIVVTKVSDLNRTSMEGRDCSEGNYENDLMKHYVGLSRIFKLIVDLKRPVVGYSPLVDLMMMYQELHEPLPASYTKFKTKVNKLFPHIYDSKHISHIVLDMCRQQHIDPDTNELEILSQYFKPGKGIALPTWKPAIELSFLTNESNGPIKQDAGWDSYYRGACFLRMAHFLAKQNGFRSMLPVPTEPMLVSDLFAAGVKQYKNHIHIAPAAVTHMVVNGPDPKPERPQSLLLKWSPVRSAQTVVRAMLPEARGTLWATFISPTSARIEVNCAAAAEAVDRRCVLGDFTVEDVEEKFSNTHKRLIVIVGMTGMCAWLLLRRAKW